jgi:exonuclease III
MNNSKITFLQHNTANSNLIHHTLLDIGVKKRIDFLLIQEPWVFCEKNENQEIEKFSTIQHSAFFSILPAGKIRPRVVIYVRKNTNYQFTNRLDVCTSNDVLFLDVFGENIDSFQLINLYNEKGLGENKAYTVERLLDKISRNQELPLLFCGDFNAHYNWWNSRITNPKRARNLVNWVKKQGLFLLNTPDLSTFSRKNTINTSIIDLGFASKKIEENILDWEILEENTGSDHEIIQFSILTKNSITFENPIISGPFNFDRADWPKFTYFLQKSEEIAIFNAYLKDFLKKIGKFPQRKFGENREN